MPAKVTLKMQVEDTKSAKWMRLRSTEGRKVTVMLEPKDLPAGKQAGDAITVTLS